MEALETLETARESAQDELNFAEIALLEATARAKAARTASERLENAVLALKGDSRAVISGGSTPIKAETTPEREQAANLTPEEFDAQRKRRQRQKEKERRENDPYGNVKCSGCQRVGTLVPTLVKTIPMLVCSKCNNQIMQ